MFSVPVYQSFQVKNDLDTAENVTIQSFRRAQLLAQAGDGDTTWGIYLQSGSITVFRGASYAARNTSFDESFTVPTSITFSGVSEVVMAKLSGDPNTTGTITLTSNTNQTASLTVTARGIND